MLQRNAKSPPPAPRTGVRHRYLSSLPMLVVREVPRTPSEVPRSDPKVPRLVSVLPRFAAMLGFAFPCAMGVFIPVAAG